MTSIGYGMMLLFFIAMVLIWQDKRSHSNHSNEPKAA